MWRQLCQAFRVTNNVSAYVLGGKLYLRRTIAGETTCNRKVPAGAIFVGSYTRAVTRAEFEADIESCHVT